MVDIDPPHKSERPNTNSNYKRVHDSTLSKVQETLQKIQMTGRPYNTLAELIKDVSVFSGVARTTIKPYRNAEAYHLVASFFGSLTVDPNKVPDEVADEFVLRLKLALARAENADLARKLNDTSSASGEALTVGIAGDETLTELYHTLIQFIVRSHGTIRVNEKKGAIEDQYPERGFDRVIASGPAIRRFGQWLRAHPTWGCQKDIFVNA